MLLSSFHAPGTDDDAKQDETAKKWRKEEQSTAVSSLDSRQLEKS